jgi:hypothetical protein
MLKTEGRIRKTYFANVPVLWQWELSQEYQELGDALSEMTMLEGADEWKIEPPVYAAASYVAAELMANSFPVPRIFSHGPESVVFNWSDEGNNLYLTVSANMVSALISSPERITQRIEYSAGAWLNPAYLLPFLGSARTRQPVISTSRSDTSQPEPVG